MIKKDYQENIFVAQCDNCITFKRIPGAKDMKEASAILKKNDWITIFNGSKFLNYCPVCQVSESKKIKQAKKSAVDANNIDKAPNTISGACTQCGGDMVLRESKFGKFYGCQRFPKCKATVKVDFALKNLAK